MDLPSGSITRKCKICSQIKAIEDFAITRGKTNKQYRRRYCRRCHNQKLIAHRKQNKEAWNESLRKWRKRNPERDRENAKAWRNRNKERVADYRRKQSIKAPLGLYGEILAQQNGLCAICGRAGPVHKKLLGLDHCHTTGQMRGVLCSPCNQAIGMMEDDIERLAAAIEYLKRYSSSPAIAPGDSARTSDQSSQHCAIAFHQLPRFDLSAATSSRDRSRAAPMGS